MRQFINRLSTVFLSSLLLCTSTPVQALDMSPVLEHFKALTRNSNAKYTIALLPIKRHDKKESNVLSSYVNDYLLQGLTQNQNFNVVDRDNIKAILKEQGFSQSAYVAPEEAVAVGNLLGARLLLTGHYTPLNENLHIHLKLIDAQSGKILTVIQEKIAKDSVALQLAPDDRKIKAVAEKKEKEAQDWKNFINGAVTVGKASIEINKSLQSDTAITAPPAPIHRSARQQIFYEDFSRFSPGTPMPSYGLSMVVRKSQRYGMNILTTENPRSRNLLHRLNLPRNFAFEIHAFDRLKHPPGISPNLLQIKLWSKNRRQVLNLNKTGHNFSLAAQSKRAPWRYQDWNVIKMVKQESYLHTYINGQKVFSRSIADIPWQGFQLQSPQLNHWAFTRISVQAL